MKNTLNKLLQWLVVNECQSLPVRAIINKLHTKKLPNKLDIYLLNDSAPFLAEDFCACEDMIKIMGWEYRIDELSDISPGWKLVVRRWPKLHQFYLDGDSVGLEDYLRIMRRTLRLKSAERDMAEIID